jgi:hypothetical protein
MLARSSQRRIDRLARLSQRLTFRSGLEPEINGRAAKDRGPRVQARALLSSVEGQALAIERLTHRERAWP